MLPLHKSKLIELKADAARILNSPSENITKSIYYTMRRCGGWSSGNTLAYHTGDPGSIPYRGGSSEKCESI